MLYLVSNVLSLFLQYFTNIFLLLPSWVFFYQYNAMHSRKKCKLKVKFFETNGSAVQNCEDNMDGSDNVHSRPKMFMLCIATH